MVLGGEGLEVELSVQLEVAQVVLLGVPQVQLRGRNINNVNVEENIIDIGKKVKLIYNLDQLSCLIINF